MSERLELIVWVAKRDLEPFRPEPCSECRQPAATLSTTLGEVIHLRCAVRAWERMHADLERLNAKIL